MVVRKRKPLFSDSVSTGQSGIPVDYAGRPTVDPTKNVLDLVDAAARRQDDIRAASDLRQNDLRAMETNYRQFIDELRESHVKELTSAEAKRIDAIRAVDVAAVATASERAAQQAQVLANQVSASAETLRGLVATTATSVTAQLGTIAQQLTDRIAALEKAQYEGKGRSAVYDPQMDKLASLVDQIATAQSQGRGKSQGAGQVIAYIVTGLSVFGMIVSLFIALSRHA